MKTNLLFVCSANMDRSPAAEALFENSEQFEAKSAGLSEFCEIPVNSQAVEWADMIFVMNERYEMHRSLLLKRFPKETIGKDIRILNISNEFLRHDPELERLLRISLEREGILF